MPKNSRHVKAFKVKDENKDKNNRLMSLSIDDEKNSKNIRLFGLRLNI